MILDTNLMKDLEVKSNYVIGRAAKHTGLLNENERIMMFDGVRTSLDYIKKYLPDARHSRSSLEGSGHAGNSFSSYDKAMDTFINNPQSLVKYDPTQMRPFEWEEQGNDLEYDVTGDFIDVGRVLEGVPENFGSLHNGNPRSRRVKIVVALSQGWSVRPEEINHRSKRVIRLIDALESANIRTELVAVDSGGCAHTEIVVKRFDEPLTIEDVAVVTHGDYFRRLMFRAAEWSDTWRGGYGDSTKLRSNKEVLKSQLNDELAVYIDGNMRSASIDPHFNKLEKMLESELSEMIPNINLMWIDNDYVGSSELATSR